MEYKNLESDRLLLVYPEECYAKETLQHLNKEVTKYMNPKAQESLEECLSFIRFAKDAIKKGTDYNYMILDKHTREFYGCCGVGRLKEKEPELGIWIKTDAHHHGYGKEAVQCMVEYFRKAEEYEGFLYPVDHRNIASRRIPESLGGRCDGTIQKTVNGNGDTLELITYHIAK